ncbi:MAG: 3-hydroxyacyl-CoA dehydrogenase family protein [Candidatus Pedobacter colombiensis]|uniref:3-hydroxyacyl-CoA dehydrogenase family protein n=1 Tax=Candidatus Pedobacter colombiensis TaxID=3121371 RepID=A0AAJ6B8Z2_9SPHI|nr:3-hydroxyacyl-CoA dehydrogenase family protein [Pedobacter sp.]WEK21001.1 MAG: 3-hydroxyacyl-CoA dehydrogenase family protein [Pedobacter sp.]
MNDKIRIGTVGLGLMGSSIATCLLAAGHTVTSLIKNIDKSDVAKERILGFLKQLKDEGLLNEDPEEVIKKLVITNDITRLSNHEVVIESIIEDLDEKKRVFRQLEAVLSTDAIIGSNTSAIPVTILQEGLNHPERLLGIHWGEPAHILRFLEVICGNQSDLKYAEKIMRLAVGWHKEPSLVKKDIRGFITNRLMYAMMREGMHLVDKGYATIEDIDRACRNDFGYWITFAGPFRFMDLTGIPAYLTVMKDLLPELDNADKPPVFFEELVAAGAKGVSNAHGFYPYTKESAERWEKLFVEFAYEIRKLSEKYPQNIGDL